MLQVYLDPCPVNSRKVLAGLDLVGLPYDLRHVDYFAGAQKKPEFLAISPNNKMPAIVDSDGPGGKPMPLAESGAILFYLASKTGRFLPSGSGDQSTVASRPIGLSAAPSPTSQVSSTGPSASRTLATTYGAGVPGRMLRITSV